MNRFIFAGLVAVLLVKSAFAQKATVTVQIAHKLSFNGPVYIYDASPKFDVVTKGEIGVALDKNQSGSYSLQLREPQYFQLSFFFSSAKLPFFYTIFLSPGDNIFCSIDFSKKDNGIVVTGKGSENNQPAISPLTNTNFTEAFAGDVLPYRVISAINKQYALNKSLLNNYIRKYKPSPDFIKSSRLNVAYFSAMVFYTFKENNKFGPQNDTYKRNEQKWQNIQDSLFKTIKLNSDEALSADNYTTLINNFVLREKERAWNESESQPKLFYRQWYHTDAAKGGNLFAAERKNLFIEKVIYKYFSGKTAEYLHAQLIKDNLYQSNYQDIGLIFNHFKQKYPASKYTEAFNEPIAAIVKRQTQPLTDKMVFVANNGTKLNTLKEVIAITKGKTVFVDMWGTWCGPCREEIEKNSAALKAYFKGKNVDFFYIANDDSANEKAWKNLIAYFNLEGTHILASQTLTKDITDKIKLTGYPTYFIIKKDGTYHKTTAHYPVDRQVLINEIELAAK